MLCYVYILYYNIISKSDDSTRLEKFSCEIIFKFYKIPENLKNLTSNPLIELIMHQSTHITKQEKCSAWKHWKL